MVHVSFDEVERFVPRVPKQICPDEDNTTPRICVAPNILSAIQAMPQGGTVAYNMARIGVPVVIHAYYIESDAILIRATFRFSLLNPAGKTMFSIS